VLPPRGFFLKAEGFALGLALHSVHKASKSYFVSRTGTRNLMVLSVEDVLAHTCE
jgi:hypothetical protein